MGWGNYELWVGPRMQSGRGRALGGTGRGIGWTHRQRQVSKVKAGISPTRVGLRKRGKFVGRVGPVELPHFSPFTSPLLLNFSLLEREG